MKTAVFGVILAVILAGCISSKPKSVDSQLDSDYRQIRGQLKNEPIPYPQTTPYDSENNFKNAYLSGFKRGWEVTIQAWLGSLMSIPPEYQRPDQLAQAWKDGYLAGTMAVEKRVEETSAKR